MGSVGRDVEALCSKCGDVWHVVVAEVSGRIAKVQCKECGAYHRYRTRAGTEKAAPRRRAAAGSRPTKAVVPDGPAIEADLSKPIRRYNIRDLFEVGERVDHPKFGIGIVEGTDAPGKITVCFPQGRKILAQAKPATTLTKPRRSFGD